MTRILELASLSFSASLNPFPTLLGGQFLKRNPEQMMIGDIGELKADPYLEHVSDSEGFSHQPKK